MSMKTHRPGSKMALAASIFNKRIDKDTRAEILERFQNDVGLTASGASTYFQALRQESGARSMQKRSKSTVKAKKAKVAKAA